MRCRIPGRAFPPTKAEIFEPFVQPGRSLTNVPEGTGLGRSISRELSRAMNGDVTVEIRGGAREHIHPAAAALLSRAHR